MEWIFLMIKGDDRVKITLAQMRRKVKFTQKDVADKIDVTPATIRNWESCITSLSILQFVSLCNLYNCSVDDIFLSYN